MDMDYGTDVDTHSTYVSGPLEKFTLSYISAVNLNYFIHIIFPTFSDITDKNKVCQKLSSTPSTHQFKNYKHFNKHVSYNT